MIFLADADVVLPDRLLSRATVVIDADRIIDVLQDAPARSPGDLHFDLRGHTVVPGFIDVHVHGVEGTDTLDGAGAIERIAARLPRYGVTAFCPTSVACAPAELRTMLAAVRAARFARPAVRRVLPAHLESNFINPDYRGAQPLDCLRLPTGLPADGRPDGEFTGADILAEIAAARPDVGIVTIAPEIEGALDLIRDPDVARTSRVARTLRRVVRAGARGHQCRRASGDASLQSHDAARSSRARAGWRRARARRCHGGDRLRRRSRASVDGAGRAGGEVPVAHHGHHRRHGRRRAAVRVAGNDWADGRSPSATRPISTTGPSRAAC